jgi:hypothetical protein
MNRRPDSRDVLTADGMKIGLVLGTVATGTMVRFYEVQEGS